MSVRQYIEFPVFTLVATGVLIMGFSISPPEDASAAAGAGGDDLVTMEASTASVETMVEDWLKPPEVSETPDMTDIAPEMSAPEMAPAITAAPPDAPRMPSPAAPAMALPDLPSLPDAALAELPPRLPPKPEPQPEAAPQITPSQIAPRTSERPQIRPDRPAPKQPPRERSIPEKTRPASQKKTAKAASVASADSAARRAAGTGGTAQAGETRRGQTATSGKAEQNSLRASWGAAIRTRVERVKRYPGRAGRAAGTVVLWLKVTSSGTLAGVGISRSSGNDLLDQAAISAVRGARMPAAPNGLSGGTHTFSLPIRFSR